MRRNARFLGGPLHGQVKQVEPTRYVTAPVMCNHSAFRDCSPACYSNTRIQTVEYEVRRIELGPLTRVEVYAPSNMAESEMMRRLADVIEGVTL